jgi:hypothetical protein
MPAIKLKVKSYIQKILQLCLGLRRPSICDWVVKVVVSSKFRQLLLWLQYQVPLGKFYCFPRIFDDLPGQAAVHGRTAGYQRPVGRVIFDSCFAMNLFPRSTRYCNHSKDVAGIK